MTRFPASLLPGLVLCYETSINGKLAIRSWVATRKRDVDRLLSVSVWGEIYSPSEPAKKPRRVYGELVTDDYFRPESAVFFTAGGKTRYEFSGERYVVHLPDGTEAAGEFQAEVAAAAGMVGMMSLAFAVHGCGRGGDPIRCFSLETLLTQVVEVEKTPDGLKTNLGELVLFDQHGFIQAMSVPEKQIEVVRVFRAPPDWHGADILATRSIQRPGRKDGIREQEVCLTAGTLEVFGSLAEPEDNVRLLAAALFIGGSGAYDRDGISPTDDLGYGSFCGELAAAGVASLRLDMPGMGRTRRGDTVLTSSYSAHVQVFDTALSWLHARYRDKAPVIIIGHSLGGVVALELSAEKPCAGIVLMATPGRTIDRIILNQAEHKLRDLDLPEASVAIQLEEIREFFRCVSDVPEWVRGAVPDRVLHRERERQWFAELMERDPCELIQKGSSPVLLLRGDRDAQVLEEDWQRLLEAAGQAVSRNITPIILPDHDHRLRKPAVEHPSSGAISEAVVHAVLDWVSRLSTKVA